MKKIGILLLFFMGGCASYDSTYWRNADTGDTVECEASWANLDRAEAVRHYCESLMKRAGLKEISHDEGKTWEASR